MRPRSSQPRVPVELLQPIRSTAAAALQPLLVQRLVANTLTATIIDLFDPKRPDLPPLVNPFFIVNHDRLRAATFGLPAAGNRIRRLPDIEGLAPGIVKYLDSVAASFKKAHDEGRLTRADYDKRCVGTAEQRKLLVAFVPLIDAVASIPVYSVAFNFSNVVTEARMTAELPDLPATLNWLTKQQLRIDKAREKYEPTFEALKDEALDYDVDATRVVNTASRLAGLLIRNKETKGEPIDRSSLVAAAKQLDTSAILGAFRGCEPDTSLTDYVR